MPNEHAVILAAGRSSRLRPLTDDSPKCLLPMGPRTILDWQLAALAAVGVS
ncbi:MAG: NTP transferase domain-containing protein, partial [Alicyclobacillus sp.]|nr:NTP transferase domain-containing protein [Alicyclobacillus sp.]